MKNYKKKAHKVTATEIAENLLACTAAIRDPKERDALYFSACRNFFDDAYHTKWFLMREVKNGPDLLKIGFHSKEELYKIFAHRISWDEFLKIVRPLDDEPTLWRAK